ncbi:MAG: transporter [Nitrospira sp.]|nr:MAG: transporter [Nitrospira sp.]
MRRVSRGLCAAVAPLIFGVSLCAEGADQFGPDKKPTQTWQMGFTPTYTSGNYGTNSTSTFLYVPFSVRRLFRDGDVTLIVPYVQVTSDGKVVLLSGTPNRVDNRGRGSGGSGSGGSGSSGSGGSDDDSELTGQTAGSRATRGGLGDIVLRGRYFLVDERDWVPMIAMTGRIKFGTASASQGLGTGKTDEGAGLEFSKALTDNLLAFLDAGYTIIGRAADLNLRNQWNYDIGLGYYVTNALLVSAYYEEFRSVVSGLQNPRDLLLAMNLKSSDLLRFNASTQIGLSNGAPDYGLTAGLSLRF